MWHTEGLKHPKGVGKVASFGPRADFAPFLNLAHAMAKRLTPHSLLKFRAVTSSRRSVLLSCIGCSNDIQD